MTSQQEAPERPQTKPFAQFLQEQRNGVLHSELSEHIAVLVATCVEHGRKGSLTLKLTVAPNKDGVTLTISDDVAIKAPQGDRGAAIFFADEDGNLSRRDPRQPQLPFKPVEAPHDDDQPAKTGTEG